ncbi:hypothetical protein N7530_009910 [Penicillium desertorum]|uniref:Uncharacterized protein n=1 Tax=Penicillium desertorum TaxID=1303715 RepID=A0A9X0BIM6_9EURO|nr:hypothetical protein N7530_009910 [Penicillium desertorum]
MGQGAVSRRGSFGATHDHETDTARPPPGAPYTKAFTSGIKPHILSGMNSKETNEQEDVHQIRFDFDADHELILKAEIQGEFAIILL